MWSVVHFPRTRNKHVIGGSSRGLSLVKGELKGSSISSLEDVGDITIWVFGWGLGFGAG